MTIYIYGTPITAPTDKGRNIADALKTAIANDKFVGITKEEIVVHVPLDAVANTLRGQLEITIKVENLEIKKGKRRLTVGTLEVLQVNIAKIVRDFFPNAKAIRSNQIIQTQPTHVFLIRPGDRPT